MVNEYLLQFMENSIYRNAVRIIHIGSRRKKMPYYVDKISPFSKMIWKLQVSQKATRYIYSHNK
jgi:hypothetical protein